MPGAGVSHNLAGIVDPLGTGIGGTGHIDGGEAAARIQEAMYGHRRVPSHNLAAAVDPMGDRTGRAGDIDDGEAAAAVGILT
jgi:hypothetical protein